MGLFTRCPLRLECSSSCSWCPAHIPLGFHNSVHIGWLPPAGSHISLAWELSLVSQLCLYERQVGRDRELMPSSMRGPFGEKGVYKPVCYAGSQQDSLYPPTVVKAAFPYLFHFPIPLPGLPGIMSLRTCLPWTYLSSPSGRTQTKTPPTPTGLNLHITSWRRSIMQWLGVWSWTAGG